MNWRAPYSPARFERKRTKTPQTHNSVMTIRTRKVFGTIALLLLALVWALTGMVVAQLPMLANSGWLQAVSYVVAGMGWVLPAMPIVSWMSRPRPG